MARINAIDIHGQLHEVGSEGIQWRPSAYAIVIDGDNILLSPQHGQGYDLPGGGAELTETMEECVIREVKEETGIDVAVISLAKMRENIYLALPDKDGHRAVWHSLMYYYVCRKIGGELSIEGLSGHEQKYADLAEWVPLSRLDDIAPAASYDWREIVREVWGSL